MSRFLPWALLALVAGAGVAGYCTRSDAVQAAEARVDSAEAVSDSLRAAVAERDRLAARTLDSLARARSRVDTAIVVVDRTRERAQAVRDSILASLEHDTGPLAGAIAAVDSACDERIRLCERRTAIADSTASVWRVRFDEERGLRFAIEDEVAAKDGLIRELRKRDLSLFGLELDVTCGPLVGVGATTAGLDAMAGVGCAVGR